MPARSPRRRQGPQADRGPQAVTFSGKWRDFHSAIWQREGLVGVVAAATPPEASAMQTIRWDSAAGHHMRLDKPRSPRALGIGTEPLGLADGRGVGLVAREPTLDVGVT